MMTSKCKQLGYALLEEVEKLEEQASNATEIKEALRALIYVVNNYLDPDEPSDEWEHGVYQALDNANKVLEK